MSKGNSERDKEWERKWKRNMEKNSVKCSMKPEQKSVFWEFQLFTESLFQLGFWFGGIFPRAFIFICFNNVQKPTDSQRFAVRPYRIHSYTLLYIIGFPIAFGVSTLIWRFCRSILHFKRFAQRSDCSFFHDVCRPFFLVFFFVFVLFFPVHFVYINVVLSRYLIPQQPVTVYTFPMNFYVSKSYFPIRKICDEYGKIKYEQKKKETKCKQLYTFYQRAMTE